MIRSITPKIPIRLPNQFNATQKVNTPILTSPSVVPVISDAAPTEATSSNATATSSQPASTKIDNANSQAGDSNVPKLPTVVQGSAKDELFALLNSAYQKAVSAASSQRLQKPAKATANPSIIPSTEFDWQRNLQLLLTGQTAATTSGKPVYNTRPNNAEYQSASASVRPSDLLLRFDSTQSSSVTTGIPPEYGDLAKLVASLPEGFDLTGWDEKSTREQRIAIQRSGLNSQAQMQLLNASTSIETIAIVQDIQRNRIAYGLTATEANDISKQLFDISNARTGAKNQAMPFSESTKATKTFLAMLQEKEASLLASFGYGVYSYEGKAENVKTVRNRIADLISGDSSISDTLHNSSDVFSTADDFFADMTELDALIGEVNDGTISFRNTAEKQRYLDYLTFEYDKNNQLYRQQLASVIDDAKLLEYPETRFKQLINDLSLSQLAVFVDQIDQFGVKKLSKAGSYEKLMRTLLADQDAALNVSADETESPIRPHVWNGYDIAKDESIVISGYYFDKKSYYLEVNIPNKGSQIICLGNTLPTNVSVEVKRADIGNIIGEQLGLLLKLYLTPAVMLDSAYGFMNMQGLLTLLPEGFGPSDLPYLGELLSGLDPLDHNAYITKNTIYVSLFIEHGGDRSEPYSSDSKVIEYDQLRQRTY